MLRSLLLVLVFIYLSFQSSAQGFSAELTGNPVNTTGWTFANGTSYVSGDMFVLTNPVQNQAGYIYYSTPQDLTLCSRFTVEFEFRFTEHSSPTADGIAFWYITNPPTGFTLGGGIGLPNNPQGLLLIFDTYNNDGVLDNPLVTLRVLDGTSNYAEGTPVGRLAPDLVNQSFIIDNNWHKCRLSFNYGNIEVSFDGGPTAMVGYTSLSMSGYFGFCAGTGSAWSRQVIRNVFIKGAPNPDPPVAKDASYCQYDPPNPLEATGDSIRWYESLTGGSPLAGPPTPNTDVPGIYTWYVTQTITGCPFESARQPVTVTVYEQVSALFEDSLHFGCEGDTLFLNYPTKLVGDYHWDFGDGNVFTGRTPYHVYTTAGTYRASLFVKNGLCEDTASVWVTIPEFLNATAEMDKDSICMGEAVRFTSYLEGEGLVYGWDFGDGTTDTSRNPIHIYEHAGIYDIFFWVNDIRGCTDTIRMSLFVDSTVVFGLQVSDTVVCAGTIVEFKTDYRPTGHSLLTWNMGDGTEFLDLFSVKYPYEVAGTYLVTLTAQYTICPDSIIPVTIQVDNYPIVNLAEDTAYCPGDAPLLLNNLTAWTGGSQYLWSTGETSNEIEVSEPGLYWLTVTNGLDCSTTDSVLVKQSCYIGIPNVFTPDGDGLNDYFFPREVLSRAVTKFQMKIFNRWGQKVFETTSLDGRGWDGRFNDKEQPQDVYIYLIEVSYRNGVAEQYQGNVTLIR